MTTMTSPKGRIWLCAILCLAASTAAGQDKGTLIPVALPPVAKPNDPKIPA